MSKLYHAHIGADYSTDVCFCDNSMRSKDWRCRGRVTPARSPWRAHVACAPRLRQRQSFERMHTHTALENIGRIISPSSHRARAGSSAYCMPPISAHGSERIKYDQSQSNMVIAHSSHCGRHACSATQTHSKRHAARTSTSDT